MSYSGAKHPQRLPSGPQQRQEPPCPSLLFMTGALKRMGTSADGNTVCDYDPEEIRRQISISTAVAPLEYKGCKINLLDTPGAFDFRRGDGGPAGSLTPPSSSAPPRTAFPWGLKKSGNTARSGTCLALSISPRPTRKTATTTPPSTPCGRSTATRLPPWWCPCGTRTRTPPASSTCSTSGPMSCRTSSGWRWTSPPTRWTWCPSSTRP